MDYKLKDFAEKLKEKKFNDKFNKDLAEKDPYGIGRSLDEKSIISFNLFVKETSLGIISFSDHGQFALTLDDEDLDYLKNKYLTQLDDEYENNLLELKSKYNKL